MTTRALKNNFKKFYVKCTEVCSDARIGPTSWVSFGLDARRRKRGKPTSRGAASCCWTGPRTTTTPPPRLATSATVWLLRLSRTTRTVTVRSADPDAACRPPVGLGPVSPHAPLSGHGPPAAGSLLGSQPKLQSARIRPAGRRPAFQVWTSTLSRCFPDTARQPPGRALAFLPLLRPMRIRPAGRRSALGLDPLTRRSPDTPPGRARARRPCFS